MNNVEKVQRMMSEAIATDSPKVVWVAGCWFGYKPAITKGGRDVYSIDGLRVSVATFWKSIGV